MEDTYKYSGVNGGCSIASNELGTQANAMEDKMANLHQDSIDRGFVLSEFIDRLLTGDDLLLYKDVLVGINGDLLILNSMMFWGRKWKGHYAKINGVWMCTPELCKVLGLIMCNKVVSHTKQSKDFIYVINAVGAATNGKWTDYMDVVNKIATINHCSIGSAKNLMTKFIREGYISKHPVGKRYQITSYITKHNSEQTEQPIVNKKLATNNIMLPIKPTQTYRPTDRTLLDSLVALKGTYNNIYSDYIDAFDARIELLDEADAFIKEYVADYRIEGKKFYNIDDWVDKRVVAQGWTSDEVIYLIYTFVDSGYVTVDYDAWTISFNKDCKKTIN